MLTWSGMSWSRITLIACITCFIFHLNKEYSVNSTRQSPYAVRNAAKEGNIQKNISRTQHIRVTSDECLNATNARICFTHLVVAPSPSFALLFSLSLFLNHSVDVKLDRNRSGRFYLCSIQSFVVHREKGVLFTKIHIRVEANKTRNKMLRSFCYCICANICSMPRAVTERIFSHFISVCHMRLTPNAVANLNLVAMHPFLLFAQIEYFGLTINSIDVYRWKSVKLSHCLFWYYRFRTYPLGASVACTVYTVYQPWKCSINGGKCIIAWIECDSWERSDREIDRAIL